MAPSLTQLSPNHLKELKKGETISVVFKDSPDGITQVIGSGFPKRVATTFASKWFEEFPPLNRIKTGSTIDKKTSVVVTGGKKFVWKKIIDWMISCCDGNGLTQFERFGYDNKPFHKYHTIRQHAREIGCKYLVDQMQSRLDHISSHQIHSEDVRELFKTEPKDSEVCQLVAEHIARHIYNQTLKSKSAYFTLREELTELNEAINTILNPLIEERNAKAMAEREAKNKANLLEARKSFHKRQWSNRAHNVTIDDDGTIHTKVTVERVRQAHSGRPAQYKLDLAKILGKDDFVRAPYRGTKSRQAGKSVQKTPNKPFTKGNSSKTSGTKVEVAEPLKQAKTPAEEEEQPQESAKDEVAANKKPEKDATEKFDVVEAGPEAVLTVQRRKSNVPGADLTNSSNRNARRRANKRATGAMAASKTSSDADTHESSEQKSESWADEMSKGSISS